MKNKNRKKGFSALTFVIFMSAILAFLIVPDFFEENAFESQLSAAKRHYEKFYAEKSEAEIYKLERIHSDL